VMRQQGIWTHTACFEGQVALLLDKNATGLSGPLGTDLLSPHSSVLIKKPRGLHAGEASMQCLRSETLYKLSKYVRYILGALETKIRVFHQRLGDDLVEYARDIQIQV
jgi:hypothetical protein